MPKYPFFKNVIILILFTSFSIYATETHEELFYKELINGNRYQAREIAFNQLSEATSLVQFDAALFRITDTSLFPEENSEIAAALKKSVDNKFSSLLYKELVNDSFEATGYPLTLTASGPFFYTSSDDFFSSSRDQRNNQSRSVNTAPISIKPNNNGIVDLSHLYPVSEQSYFKISILFNAESAGYASIILGKTGFTRLNSSNDKPEIQIKTSHHFSKDQYRIPINITKGLNTLTILCASNSDYDKKLSIRIVPETTPLTFKNRWSYYYSSDSKLPTDQLNLVYLYYKQGLYGNNNIANTLLSSVNSPSLSSISSYLNFLLADNPGAKIHYSNILNSSQQSHTLLYQEALIFMEANNTERALQKINRLKEIAPHSEYTLLAELNLFLQKNWLFKAEPLIDKLFTFSPALSTQQQADIFYRKQNFSKAADRYESLAKQFPDNFTYVQNHLESLKRSVNSKLYTAALYRYSFLFPERDSLKLTLANQLLSNSHFHDSLLILSSLKNSMPNNPDMHYLLAKNYQILNKKELSKHHAFKAQSLNPSQTTYRNFYFYNYQNNEYLQAYTKGFDTDKLNEHASKLDAPVVILFQERVEKFNTNGTSLERVRTTYRINSAKQNDSLKTISFTLNSTHDTIKAFNCSLETETGSHSLTGLSRRNLSDPESRLYYDIDRWTLSLPQLPDDSLLIVDYTIEKKSGRDYSGYIGKRYYFSEHYPVLKRRIYVITPEKTPLFWNKNSTQGSLIFSKEKGSNRYLYTQEYTDAKIYESNQLPAFNRTPSITACSFESWESLFNWYAPLVHERETFSSEMEKDFSSLINDSMTDEEKIRAIYSFITGRTRYLGFEIGIGGIQPRHAHITYQSRLGDCKDIALLLAAFYKRAGFQAWMALIRTTSGGYPDLESPYIGNFNHAICYVDFKGGLFLDGTVNHADIYDLPESDRGTTTTVVKDNSFEFISTDSPLYSANRDSITTDVVLNSDGSVTLFRSLKKEGYSATIFRNRYKSDDVQLSQLTRYWNRLYPGASVSNYIALNRTGRGPLQYSYTISIPNFYNPESQFLKIPLDPVPFSYLENHAATSMRFSPLYFSSSEDIRTTTTYTIPENFSIVSFPSAFESTFFNISFSLQTSETEANTVTINKNFSIKKEIISEKNYDQFRNKIIEIEKISKQPLLLKQRN
ncbi:MAG: DUF3857 domain-containing protein [Spirochaetes bacterium]|jgi:transglutaminase-like putative cysteine protease|nr:DUF3857 domain-containing protein [Spirochaetota bacterium]